MKGVTVSVVGPPAVLDTFLAVRWPEGVYCGRCHSDRAVQDAPWETRVRKAAATGVKVYHCRFCRYYFSDLAGTVLEHTHLPLVLAAWTALGGDPATVPLAQGYQGRRRELRRLAGRLEDTALARDWKAALAAAGVTRETLQPLVEQWAGNHQVAVRSTRGSRAKKERTA